MARKILRGSWGSSSDKVIILMLKILTALIKRCFALFGSNFLSARTPFSLLSDVIGTLLPALVINNEVISMPRSLHKFLWTSDVVRMRVSFHSYRFSYTAVLQMKQQDLVFCFQSWTFTSAQQLGSPLNTSFERGISKIGGFSPCVWLTC